MADDRIAITRAEFERLWGWTPPVSATGAICRSEFHGLQRRPVEYVFTDAPQPELAELERMLKLEDPR